MFSFILFITVSLSTTSVNPPPPHPLLTVRNKQSTMDSFTCEDDKGSWDKMSSIRRAVARLSVLPLSVQGCLAICSNVNLFSGSTTNWPVNGCWKIWINHQVVTCHYHGLAIKIMSYKSSLNYLVPARELSQLALKLH